MIKELLKYRENGHFLFRIEDSLAEVCNAPRHSSGLYSIYTMKDGIRELIYIGISGRIDEEGKIKHRKDGFRGRFLTGKTDGIRRKIAWPNRMKAENISKLVIHWYVTYGEYNQDIPRELEVKLLRQFQLANDRLPNWNNRK